MSYCRREKCLCNSLRQTAVFLCNLFTSEDEFKMIDVAVVAHNGKTHCAFTSQGVKFKV